MFNERAALQEALDRRATLTGADQWCDVCHAWTAVPLDTLRAALDTAATGEGVPMKPFPCTRPGTKEHTLFVLPPGKYDRLRGGKYSMQRYTFADDPSIGAPKVTKATRMNLSVLREVIAKAPGGIIDKLSPVDHPHVKRCLAAGLLEPAGEKKWKLSPAGVAALGGPQ